MTDDEGSQTDRFHCVLYKIKLKFILLHCPFQARTRISKSSEIILFLCYTLAYHSPDRIRIQCLTVSVSLTRSHSESELKENQQIDSSSRKKWNDKLNKRKSVTTSTILYTQNLLILHLIRLCDFFLRSSVRYVIVTLFYH